MSDRLHIEASSADLPALAGVQPYAAGRAADGRTVLVRGLYETGQDARVPAADCLVLPKPIDADRAVLVPAIAWGLAAWQTLGLELGELAVWTAGHPLSTLIGQIAIWRGACPGVQLGEADPEIPHAERIDTRDAEEASRKLADVIAKRPGFAAIDLTGRADIIDLYLEAMPRWGRLLLAGPQGAPVTIDFYKNIHRTGAVIPAMVVEPAQVFDAESGADLRAQVSRAIEVLRNPATARRCQSLLGMAVAAQPQAQVVAVR